MEKKEIKKLGQEIDIQLSKLFTSLMNINHKFVPDEVEDFYDVIDDLPKICIEENHGFFNEYAIIEIKDGNVICNGIYNNHGVNNVEFTLHSLTVFDILNISLSLE
jgi:hypothetical protein